MKLLNFDKYFFTDRDDTYIAVLMSLGVMICSTAVFARELILHLQIPNRLGPFEQIHVFESTIITVFPTSLLFERIVSDENFLNNTRLIVKAIYIFFAFFLTYLGSGIPYYTDQSRTRNEFNVDRVFYVLLLIIPFCYIVKPKPFSIFFIFMVQLIFVVLPFAIMFLALGDLFNEREL